jgi:hypothetical protein
MIVIDPFFLFHKILVHHCNLARGTAETDEAELQPVHERFTEFRFVQHADSSSG